MAEGTVSTPSNAGSGRSPALPVMAIVAVFVLFWTLFATLSRYNLDIHGDMVENFAWGIAWQLGYYKHPPLYSWISAAWLSVLPRTNFFYHLLSMTSVAVAALGMWRIATRFFTPNQQVLLVAMVFFLPPLTFLSINYNATSAMAPFWAFTLLFYIRVLEKRRLVDALLLGLLGGLAVLAKYHSVVLVLALLTHAIADRQARPLFQTMLLPAAAIGALIPIGPHIYWLFDTGFLTVRYASDQGDGNRLDSLWSAATFIPAMLLYALPGFALLLAHRYPRDGRPIVAREQVRMLSLTVEGRALLAAIFLPPLYTILLGLALHAELSSLWSIPFFVFIPFIMVSFMPKLFADRRGIVLPVLIGLFCFVALAWAPTIKRYTLEIGRSNSAVPISYIARTVQEKWREKAQKPLVLVAAETNFLANGTAFYASDRPYAIQGMSLTITPWVTGQQIVRDGGVMVCLGLNPRPACELAAKRMFGRIDARAIFIAKSPRGAIGPKARGYQILMRLPASK